MSGGAACPGPRNSARDPYDELRHRAQRRAKICIMHTHYAEGGSRPQSTSLDQTPEVETSFDGPSGAKLLSVANPGTRGSSVQSPGALAALGESAPERRTVDAEAESSPR